MAAKDIRFSTDARDRILRGVEILNNWICATSAELIGCVGLKTNRFSIEVRQATSNPVVDGPNPLICWIREVCTSAAVSIPYDRNVALRALPRPFIFA